MGNKVVTPKHLGNEGAALYAATVREYGVEDAMGRALLAVACESLDRLREAQKILKREGLVTRDRNGICRPHPATVIERNSRSALFSGFRALGLDPPKVSK